MSERGSQAVVLGAGIAGLLSAAALTDFHESVVVVERDRLPDRSVQRTGVPQGRHLHQFLSRGVQAIEELVPGILDDLAAAGAVVDESGDLSRVYTRVAQYELNPTGRFADAAPLAAYQASRPFLEYHLRRRIAGLHNVTILDNHDVIEAIAAEGKVTGARIINRDNGKTSTLDACLVVDATGRGGRTAHFLENHGFGTPPEERIASIGGYSSQLLRIPLGRINKRIAFVNDGPRSPVALLVAYENDTWMLAIGCPTACGNPPNTFAEMMSIAEDLLPSTIMSGLRAGTPVGSLSISRNTAALWRRFDQMLQLPSGLIALGDAYCHVNPLHGQGMTMAALQALSLRDCLRAGDDQLPQRFYRTAAEHISPAWRANRASDVPSTHNTRSVRRRLQRWTQHASLRAATTDIAVAERFLRVRGLIDPPERLRDTALLLRIMTVNVRQLHLHRCITAQGSKFRRTLALRPAHR